MAELKRFPLAGVCTLQLKRHIDERGFFVEIARSDWTEMFGNEWIVQVNTSMSYPGIVRAWHRHRRGQIDYFFVLKGSLKICAFDPSSGEMAEIIATEYDPTIVRIPGHYWHGTKNIGNKESVVVYFVTQLYDYTNPDEERLPWNDSTIIPRSINGNTKDPRVNKPWDWYYRPNK